MAMSVEVSINFSVDKKTFCKGCLLQADDLDATLFLMLSVALGDNESLDSTRRIFIPETGRRRRRPAPYPFPH